MARTFCQPNGRSQSPPLKICVSVWEQTRGSAASDDLFCLQRETFVRLAEEADAELLDWEEKTVDARSRQKFSTTVKSAR